jgi:hypothetical protein
MFRIKALPALVALAVAGAFAASSSPAMAFTNFQVNFKIQNNDTSNSMIRGTSPLPSGISGLVDPAAEIIAGSADPGSGFATFSLPYPAKGQSVSASLQYHLYAGSTSACTFTIKVTRNNDLSFTAHFSSTDSTRCPVPSSDVTNSDGQFTSTTYGLGWRS